MRASTGANNWTWNDVGDCPAGINAMVEHQGSLYAISYSQAGTAGVLMSYNPGGQGTPWVQADTGPSASNGIVIALISYNGNLYALCQNTTWLLRWTTDNPANPNHWIVDSNFDVDSIIGLVLHDGNLYGISDNKLMKSNLTSPDSPVSWVEVSILPFSTVGYPLLPMASYMGGIYTGGDSLWRWDLTTPGGTWVQLITDRLPVTLASHNGLIYGTEVTNLWAGGATFGNVTLVEFTAGVIMENQFELGEEADYQFNVINRTGNLIIRNMIIKPVYDHKQFTQDGIAFNVAELFVSGPLVPGQSMPLKLQLFATPKNVPITYSKTYKFGLSLTGFELSPISGVGEVIDDGQQFTVVAS